MGRSERQEKDDAIMRHYLRTGEYLDVSLPPRSDPSAMGGHVSDPDLEWVPDDIGEQELPSWQEFRDLMMAWLPAAGLHSSPRARRELPQFPHMLAFGERAIRFCLLFLRDRELSTCFFDLLSFAVSEMGLYEGERDAHFFEREEFLIVHRVSIGWLLWGQAHGYISFDLDAAKAKFRVKRLYFMGEGPKVR